MFNRLMRQPWAGLGDQQNQDVNLITQKRGATTLHRGKYIPVHLDKSAVQYMALEPRVAGLESMMGKCKR